MDVLGSKECWDIELFDCELLSFVLEPIDEYDESAGAGIWCGHLDKTSPYIQNLDEFLTLDYGRAPYDVWIEASNSTYNPWSCCGG